MVGFVAVKKLRDKQGWLTKRGVAGRPATAFYRAGIHVLVKRWTKRWKWTEMILKSDKLIVNVVVFKLCNCIWGFLKSKGEKIGGITYLLTLVKCNRYPSTKKNLPPPQLSVLFILKCEVFADYASSYSIHSVFLRLPLSLPALGIPSSTISLNSTISHSL